MDDAFIKAELHEWINEASSHQLQEFYDLFIDYLNHNGEERWDELPEHLKARILQGLAEAEAGLGRPARDIIRETREKYRLNE
jgi:hypothetical protein